MNHFVDQFYPERQYGFTARRQTAHMIYCLRNIAKIVREKNIEWSNVFDDLKKVFDSFNCYALWSVLNVIGISDKMLNLLISLREYMHIKSDGKLSSSFHVKHLPKQECIMSPVLFVIYFFLMLEDTFFDSNSDVLFEFKTGRLLLTIKHKDSL